MNQEKLHMRDFGEHTVWVTTYCPAVFEPASGEYRQDGFICAYMIDAEPRMYDGEYVKENGKPKFFPDHNSALCAAFEAARKRIRHES